MPEPFLGFVPGSPHAAWILVAGGVVWLVLMIFELRDPGQRFFLRISLVSLALASLILAGLQPGSMSGKDPGKAILLTSGATPDAAISYRDSLQPNRLFGLGNPEFEGLSELEPIPDIAYLNRHFPAIQNIHVLGDGLSPEELRQLKGQHLSFSPAGPRAGFAGLWYEPRLRVGDSIHVQGVYFSDKSTGNSFFAEGALGRELLWQNDTTGIVEFMFSEMASREGKYVIRIQEESPEGKILAQHPFPIEVDEARPVRVLLVEDAPSFETRHLKNWLVDKGYALSVVSAISKERSITEFFNLPSRDLLPLREDVFEELDLLVITGRALAQRGASERSALRNAVQQGLGVVLLVDGEMPILSAPDKSFFLDFPTRSAAGTFRLPGDPDIELEKAPYNLLPSNRIRPLLTSRTGGILAASRPKGKGFVSLQLAAATYRLLLDGQNKAYYDLWNPILEETARRIFRQTQWEVRHPLLAQAGFPVEINLYSPEAKPIGKVLAPDSSELEFYFRQNPFLPKQWEGRFWPDKSGWHLLKLKDNPLDSSWMYIQEPGAWPGLHRASHTEATLSYMASQDEDGNSSAARVEEYRPYSLLWFYLIFLFAMGGLWLEERW